MNVCSILGIEKPVIQAPMAGVQNWELATAVAEAGGLGSIPCGMLSKTQIMTEIEHFKARSNKPYNLNFFCHQMPTVTSAELGQWHNRLSDYYTELAVQPPSDISGLRLPFDQAIADALESYQPPVISFHFGLPSVQLVKQVKSWGSVILSSATTTAEGLWLQQHGADIVIAQGAEAGGHRGLFLDTDLHSAPATQLPTRQLVTELQQVLSVPVIAAGGIASHSHIQELMALGAAGAQVGTAYLLCDEAKTSPVHRAALKSADSTTALTNIFSGRLARGISNRVMRELGFINNHAPAFPYAAVALAPLRAKAEAANRSDFSPLWSGTERSGCKEISAAQLTEQLWPASSDC